VVREETANAEKACLFILMSAKVTSLALPAETGKRQSEILSFRVVVF
jgi:hypothetical protein